MNTILMAMTRDLIYRCRWSFLGFALIANLMPLLLFIALRSEGIAANDPHLRLLLFRLMSLNAIFGAASLIDSYPFLSRLFIAPVSSSKLFYYMLIPQILIAGAGTLLVVMFQNWSTSQAFPARSAALVSSCSVAVCWSTHWMTYKKAWQPIAFAITLGGFLSWYLSRFPWIEQSEPITDLSNLECLALCAIVIFFSWGGYHGFARFRCGEGFETRIPFLLRWSQHSHIQPNLIDRFSTPYAAQLWYEWSSRGWVLPLFVTVGILTGVVTWAIRSRDPLVLFQGLVDGGYLLPSLGGVLGICALGNYGFSWVTGNQKLDFELAQFLASRPLTNTTLAYANLLTLGKSIVIAWGIWLASIVISYGYVLDSPLLYTRTVAWWYLPAILVLLWTVTTTFTSLTLTGKRHWFVMTVLSLTFGCSFAMITAERLLEPASKAKFFQLAQIGFGIGTSIGTAWLFKRAHARQLISKSITICCGWIWLLLTAAIAFEAYRDVEHRPMSIYFAVIGIASLTVAPLATSPLAIARNRTR